LARLGVWENGTFIGAVVFSSGSSGVGCMSKGLGISPVEIAELARVALTTHRAEVSRIVAIALRCLKKAMPGLRVIVSYADPEQGHLGVIYQAGGWVYTGRSASDVAYYDRTGKRWHSRSVSETGWKTRLGKQTRAPRISDMKRTVKLESKYRYLMPLDEEMKCRIETRRKPYPKRAGSIASDATAIHAEEGGATPTPALQKVMSDGK